MGRFEDFRNNEANLYKIITLLMVLLTLYYAYIQRVAIDQAVEVARADCYNSMLQECYNREREIFIVNSSIEPINITLPFNRSE